MNRDLQNTDSAIQRLARQHLLDIEREEVGVVHHRREGRVHHVANESGQTRDLQPTDVSI